MPVDYKAVCKALKGFCAGEITSCGACVHITVPMGTGICRDCDKAPDVYRALFQLADTSELLHRRHAENLPESYYPYVNSVRRLSENAIFVLLTLSTQSPR